MTEENLRAFDAIGTCEKRVLYLCHGMYGCETGCCGFRLCEDDEGDDVVGEFVFSHGGYESPREFAEKHWPRDVGDATVLPGKWVSCD